MGNSNKKRHLDLSVKLIEMGHALVIEGDEKKDYSIMQTGNIMIFMGGLLSDEKDIYLFAELCSMFSAKKILDNIELTKKYENLLSYDNKDKITYDEFIKRLNKLKGDDDKPNN